MVFMLWGDMSLILSLKNQAKKPIHQLANKPKPQFSASQYFNTHFSYVPKFGKGIIFFIGFAFGLMIQI
jgi:hypothetical protein